jgi:hypothetical protein
MANVRRAHLQSLLNIPEVDARRYVSHLIADGVLKPNPILQKVRSPAVEHTRQTAFAMRLSSVLTWKQNCRAGQLRELTAMRARMSRKHRLTGS